MKKETKKAIKEREFYLNLNYYMLCLAEESVHCSRARDRQKASRKLSKIFKIRGCLTNEICFGTKKKEQECRKQLRQFIKDCRDKETFKYLVCDTP